MAPRPSGARYRAWDWYTRAGKYIRAIPIWRLRLGALELGDWVDGLVTRFLPTPREPRIVPTQHGFQLLLPGRYRDFQAYESGAFESTTCRRFIDTVQEGAFVIDVGAHVGYYTILGSQLVGRLGKVLAFEPDPVHFCSLQENVQINGCENVRLVNAALGSERARSRFFSQPSNSGGSLYRRRYTGNDRLIEVDIVSLDEFLRTMDWPRVDVIKMDIEGGERMALEGMREAIFRNPDIRLFIEFELRSMRAAGVQPIDLVTAITTLGFVRFILLGDEEETEVNLPSEVDKVVRAARREGHVNILCES